MQMGVAELLAKAGFGGDPAALVGQPKAEVGNQRRRVPRAVASIL